MIVSWFKPGDKQLMTTWKAVETCIWCQYLSTAGMIESMLTDVIYNPYFNTFYHNVDERCSWHEW